MSLRRQLILVSLLLLALPWAGCQFMREIEVALRQGQASALQATAGAVANALGQQSELLYPYPRRLREPAEIERSLYATVSDSPIIVDGYGDGWPGPWTGRFSHPDGTPSLRYRAATRDGVLYLLLEIEDARVVYDNPGLSPEPNGDRLLLQTWLDDRRQEYVISTAAPGSVRARHAGRRHPGVAATRIRGYWQDRPNGYTLELELPLAITGGRLGLRAIDVNPPGGGGPRTAGNSTALEQTAPPWLIFSPAPLRAALAGFAQPGQSLTVVDRSNQVIARATHRGATTAEDAAREADTFWLLRAIYRRVLATQGAAPLPQAGERGILAAEEIQRAQTGQAEARWYRDPDQGTRVTLSAAAPISAGGQVIGAVVARQSNEEYLSLTDRAFTRLLGYSLLATAGAALGLLVYVSILSWRIGRLSRAAGRVMQRGNLVLEAFPHSRARDEIGELSRRYAQLLAELKAYNEYLRTLSRQLSHELRTPIAVIQSSLDNLPQQADEHARAVYIDRAREGLARLNRILTAMTEASRVEDSVRGEPLRPLNLVPLLREILPAYQGAHPEHAINLHCEPQQAWIMGAPDLLVQALDKLVDNAVSFAPPGSAIQLGLAPGGEDWQLWVENPGSALPQNMQGQLFEAMVSVRDQRQGSTPHLGLGLYIVRLIVDYLGGQAKAENLPGAQGVRFSLRLPRSMPGGVAHTR